MTSSETPVTLSTPSVSKVFFKAEIISQNFPTVSRTIVEPLYNHHQNTQKPRLQPCRDSDEKAAIFQNILTVTKVKPYKKLSTNTTKKTTKHALLAAKLLVTPSKIRGLPLLAVTVSLHYLPSGFFSLRHWSFVRNTLKASVSFSFSDII